jgi:hypothetical protein
MIRGSLAVMAIAFAGCGVLDAATLSGSVADPTGDPIPGATVIASLPSTALRATAVTGSNGHFTLSELAPGAYTITVNEPGFRVWTRGAVVVTESGAPSLEIVLQLAPHSDTVVVTEQSVILDPSATQAGHSLDEQALRAIPLNGRSVTDLLAIQPGIAPASAQQPNAVVMAGVASTPPSGGLNAGNLSVSGQRETANGFRVNGADVEETVNMGTAIIPNLDSIAELQVLTNNFNAEYGNYSGGQVLLVTKSGANQFHGSAFEFLRNTALDARNFFSSAVARFDQNQFGGTLGGPIRRDRVFFFVDYQGARLTQGVDTGLIPVPSLADRAGNLQDMASSLTGAVNGQYWANLLSQRLGYAVQPNEPYYKTGCSSSAECVFPNAIIPQSAWSAPARALLQYVPTPTTGGDFSTSAYNQITRDDKGSVRADAETRLGRIAAYYFADDYSVNNPYPTGQGGANVPGFNALNFGRAQLLSFAVAKAFGAKNVNEFHASYMRNANVVGQPSGGVGPSLSSQGFVTGAGSLGIVPLAPKIEGIENVSLRDFTLGVDTTGLRQVNTTLQVSDQWSRSTGAHNLKLGAEAHFYQVNTNPDAQYNGSFSFQGTETGSDFADFLMGIASSYTQADSQSFYNRNRYLGAFAQDSWRVGKTLTLNYGVRWDVISPWHEKYNQLQTLVLGQQSSVYPGAPKGLVFRGDVGIPSTLAPTRYDRFSPRAGLAWSPGAGKTVIRAGYGLFYTAFEGLAASIMSANPPYGDSYSSPAPPLFSTPFVAAATGATTGQPFPLPFPGFGASASKPDSAINWARYEPITGVPSFSHDNVPPYAESYTLALERRLGTHSTLSAAYVGTQAHHLLVIEEANPGNPALCLAVAGCGPFAEGGTRGPFGSAFGSVSYQKTIGNSAYNALEVSVRHSSGPLEFLAGYTFSKSLDESSSLAEAVNPLNPRLNRALSAFDLTHNFVASFHYQLPLARLLPGHAGFTYGWELSGITRFSTGFPVTFYNNNDTSLLGTIPNGVNNNGVDTPNFTPGALGINTNGRNGQQAFNTALFSLPALGQLGTAARRFFHGPGIENFDLALQKMFRLAENKSFALRVEAFNAWNHAQFYGAAAVNGDISSPDFGRIVSAAPPRLIQVAAKFTF